MAHVVTALPPPIRACGGALEIHAVPVWKDNLSWIAVCTQTGEGGVIDGPEAEPVLARAEQLGIELSTILNTHVHGDHVGINRDLARRGELSRFRVVGAGETRDRVPGITQEVGEGATVRLGALTGRVLDTPGHLDGHVSFVFGDALFCGDTLFCGGCGYLFDGPPATMLASLEKLAALDGATRVFCAHEYTQDNLRFAWSIEPENAVLADRIREVWEIRGRGGCTVPSTIGQERLTNPFLRSDSADLRRHVAAQVPDARLDSALTVFTATRALKDQKLYRALPDAQLPLRGAA